MSDAAISAQRKTTIAWRLTVTIPSTGDPFNLTDAGVSAVLSIRRRPSDPAPLITKTYDAADPTAEPGMLVVDGNLLDVKLTPDDTDPDTYPGTGIFTGTEWLIWDVLVTDGDGDVTAIEKGALTVRAGAGS